MCPANTQPAGKVRRPANELFRKLTFAFLLGRRLSGGFTVSGSFLWSSLCGGWMILIARVRQSFDVVLYDRRCCRCRCCCWFLIRCSFIARSWWRRSGGQWLRSSWLHATTHDNVISRLISDRLVHNVLTKGNIQATRDWYLPPIMSKKIHYTSRYKPCKLFVLCLSSPTAWSQFQDKVTTALTAQWIL